MDIFMAAQKRWEAAVLAAEARVNNLARSLRGIKAAFGRSELGAADYHRKIADKIDAETATLSRMFVDNCPPLDSGFADARMRYRARQDRIHATITEIARTL